MTLDPQARAVLAADAGLDRLMAGSCPMAQRRQDYEDSRRRLSLDPAPVSLRSDLQMQRPGQPLRLRLYRPEGAPAGERLPALVWAHGGGWVLGSLDSHEALCCELANAAGAAVVAVDYRLAPEHPFPAAVEDMVDALRWVRAEAERLAIDPARLAVGGDSAGANLAAAASIILREAADPQPVMQVLIYPTLDQAGEFESQRRLGEGYGLTTAALCWFREHYLGDAALALDWRASPLRAPDLGRLPPAYIVTAGFDPLRDEGEAYAARLREAAVPVTYECFEGMIHGFIVMSRRVAAAHHAVYRVAQQLRARWSEGAHARR
jgi:acetyl esterase